MKLWHSGDLQGATLASHWTFTPLTTGRSLEPGPGPGLGTSARTSLCPGSVYGPGPCPIYGTGTDTDFGPGPVDSPGPGLCPIPGPDLKLPVLCRSVIVIGAPKASNNQSDIEQGGAVYLCPWNTGDVTSSMCDIINLDATGVLAPPPPLPPFRGVVRCVCGH